MGAGSRSDFSVFNAGISSRSIVTKQKSGVKKEYTDDSSVLVGGQGVDIIPEVASSYRPVKGMMFSSIDQAIDFYSEYAKKAGFGVRKGGSYLHDGVLKTKYCCKEGHKPAKMYDSKVHDFVEGHNHRMVADSDMQFVRFARKLTHVQEDAIYELSNINLGPVKTFNLMRTQYGGFEKKTFSSDYSFEFDVNDYRELIRVFWVDEISKSNYLEFGNIISFDATFKTNNVTVGARLLACETIESYTWLLQMLLKSFGSAPKVVVTDKDPAMKQAIAFVFPNTRHRLCMWHIMKKVADKAGADLCNNEDFKSRLCNIVWTDSISPFQFKEKWQAIMVEFELELDKNKWLTDMYKNRFDWIPAFYRDEPLFGLMRMISCEEEGGYFRCKIWDFNAYVPGFLEVVFKKDNEFGEESTVTCFCKGFEQYVPMSEFGNDQNRKIKEISREIKYADEYLINSYVADIDELIKVRNEMNLMIEKADLTRYERVRPSKRDRFALF
ncbi:protein FAR-RED IMPAIRED RESPONSE 1-like [Bidens hawaiensis]|uniref:protein FAR-RED IMPAIRED RESPONSE 1-like n=1 Tax=Bidens hawaiensis TaxID=980011 RepID=UPI00404A53B8